MRVLPSEALPIVPSDGEVARRIVRHGLSDVLTWLGEDLGPKPSDQTHAVASKGWLFVSPQLHDQLAAMPRGKTISWDLIEGER